MAHRPTDLPDAVTLHAPAKLNLTLEVGPPRAEDGYHPIASVMVPLHLADELRLTRTDGNSVRLEVRQSDPQAVPVAVGSENLAFRAAALLADEAGHMGRPTGGVHISLVKHIPVAAGLGGGSADAAAVLVGLNQLWGLGLSEAALAELGARLGADIPFCVRSRPGLVEGIGEVYTTLSDVPPLPVVLVNPRRPLVTGEVYRRFDAAGMPSRPGRRTVNMIRALHSGYLPTIADNLYNDLESAACELLPEIEGVRRLLAAGGALGTLVSGSGPTLFAIAKDLSHAAELAERCRAVSGDAGNAWWTWSGWCGTPPPDAPQGMSAAGYPAREAGVIGRYTSTD